MFLSYCRNRRLSLKASHRLHEAFPFFHMNRNEAFVSCNKIQFSSYAWSSRAISFHVYSSVAFLNLREVLLLCRKFPHLQNEKRFSYFIEILQNLLKFCRQGTAKNLPIHFLHKQRNQVDTRENRCAENSPTDASVASIASLKQEKLIDSQC